MAVANTKVAAITDLDAGKTVNRGVNGNGAMGVSVGTLEVAAADDDNSVYRFGRVPSNAVMRSIRVYNDAITGGTDYNIGLWDTAKNGGAVVSENLFGDAVSMAGARVAPLDVLHEQLDVANAGKRVWELLGLSADPQKEYDLAAIGITVGTGAGTLSVYAEWTTNV